MALVADAFDRSVVRGLPRVITVRLGIDVEVMKMIMGMLTTGTIACDTMTEMGALQDGEALGAVGGIVDVVGLGVVLETILKSALHTIDSIGP